MRVEPIVIPDSECDEIEAAFAKAAVPQLEINAALARVPPSWTMVRGIPYGGAFKRGNVQVLFSVHRYDDGRIWLHVSACVRLGAREFDLPAWEDLKRVKNDFIGPDRWAYQVLPPTKDYVNDHACVLHLFALATGEPALPDFTMGTGRI